jgi:hypothetical protein
MIRVFVVVVGTVAGLLTSASPAVAGCEFTPQETTIDGAIQVTMTMSCAGAQADGTANSSQPPRDSDWDAVCVRTAIDVGLDPLTFCNRPLEEDAPTITPGLVAAAFQRIPLPEAPLVIQPPNGRTLVNFKTNFYTEQGELSRTVTLLGRQVELRIWPASFTWQFGDGEWLQSTEPGAKYPDLQITHEYVRKGRVSPSVDTTYAAQFRVDGGPWRDVNGTVTIPGSPQGLRVVEARPVLVGG